MDSYGQLKLLAEQVVRQSNLDWVVLRLGAVVSVDLRALPIDSGTMFLEWSLPVDGRINTVDVRDVASAFAAATSADVGGEVLLIGGDDTHRHVQGDLGPAMVAALGLDNCYPAGRPGDPATTPRGSSATGWTRNVRSRRCRFRTTPGHRWSPRCAAR